MKFRLKHKTELKVQAEQEAFLDLIPGRTATQLWEILTTEIPNLKTKYGKGAAYAITQYCFGVVHAIQTLEREADEMDQRAATTSDVPAASDPYLAEAPEMNPSWEGHVLRADGLVDVDGVLYRLEDVPSNADEGDCQGLCIIPGVGVVRD